MSERLWCLPCIRGSSALEVAPVNFCAAIVVCAWYICTATELRNAHVSRTSLTLCFWLSSFTTSTLNEVQPLITSIDLIHVDVPLCVQPVAM